MKLEHTPGPWVVGDDKWAVFDSKDYHLVSAYSDNWNGGASEEDMRLIASSPEMLNALIRTVSYVDVIDIDIMNPILKAIEAATGKTWEELNGTIQD